MSKTGKHLEPVDSNERDTAYWEAVERIVAARGYGTKDLLRNFQAYAMRRDLSRFLSHYELFKLVVDLPGSIVELGIYKGASFFAWAKLLDMFCPGTWDRLVYGFDRFDGLHGYMPEDGELGTHAAKREGGLSDTSFEEIETLAALHDVDGLMRGTRRCRIVAGDVMTTLPDFLDKNPGLRISLLNLDLDLYEPTKFALELLYPRVVHGGVICFDEYSLLTWPGETRAVDEYFASIGEKPIIHRHSFAQRPTGYIIK
jgi:Macrocin-O-methyltransferase (TylF)